MKKLLKKILDRPALRIISIIVLIILGVLGCLLPFFPGLIFLALAAYLIYPHWF